MKVVLLVSVILGLALVHGGQGLPCVKNRTTTPPTPYDVFENRHIIKPKWQKPEPSTRAQWEEYLTDHGLCGRSLRQEFISKRDSDRVDQICTNKGRRPVGVVEGHLCIGLSKINVHHVESSLQSKCKVNSIQEIKQYVIVGCDKVHEICVPTHYEHNDGQVPDKNRPCTN